MIRNTIGFPKRNQKSQTEESFSTRAINRIRGGLSEKSAKVSKVRKAVSHLTSLIVHTGVNPARAESVQVVSKKRALSSVVGNRHAFSRPNTRNRRRAKALYPQSRTGRGITRNTAPPTPQTPPRYAAIAMTASLRTITLCTSPSASSRTSTSESIARNSGCCSTTRSANSPCKAANFSVRLASCFTMN